MSIDKSCEWIEATCALPPVNGGPYDHYVLWLEISYPLKKSAKCRENKSCEYASMSVLLTIYSLQDDDEQEEISKDMLHTGTLLDYSHYHCRQDIGVTPHEAFDDLDLKGQNLRWSLSNIKRWVKLPSVEMPDGDSGELKIEHLD